MTDIVTSPVDMSGVLIPVDTGGLFTPGGAAALDTAIKVINATWDQANTKTSTFEAKIGAIDAWLPDATPSDVVAGVAASPAIIEPDVEIPASVSTTDIMDLFDTKYLELVALLVDKFTVFQATYFPNDMAAYTAVDAWLEAALANPNSALPPAVAAQLMTDATDRITADALRASDSTIATFAARRFPLPPGAAAGVVLQIQQKAQDEVAEAGRKLTIQSIEQVKFAVEKLISLRSMAMTSAVEYIKALASGPDMASRLVSVGYDAQSKLISAASQFYGVRAEVSKIATQNNQYNVSSALEAATKNQIKDLTLVEDKLKALLVEAQALAQMATAMFNNLHAQSGATYSVSVA